jgi:dipeptidyl aminopeptidase/acylaminoacyl peptidase
MMKILKGAALLCVAPILIAQTGTRAAAPAVNPIPATGQSANGQNDEILKSIDDLMWRLKLSDIAEVDKFAYTSLPPANERNPTAQGAGNPMIVYAYSLIPKKLDRTKKNPLIVYVHGGVHSNLESGGAANSAHIARELLEQGYTIVAPDYRGSTGYGMGYYRAIDYGGREVDDTYAAREWMLERYSFLDPKRVGIIGWSHGGYITLMNIFLHPNAWAAAYAGCPVSDLVARMGYKTDGYRKTFSDMIGKDANDNVKEYLKRSPYTYAAKLNTPLLIHTNTNDEDVNVLEVRHMIDSLKAEGKKFEYKIYEDAPGGHHFNRIDTKLARDSRAEIWAFLNKHMKQ